MKMRTEMRDGIRESPGSSGIDTGLPRKRQGETVTSPPRKQPQKPPIPLNIENWTFSNTIKRRTGVSMTIKKVNQTFDIVLSIAISPCL